MDPDSRAHNNPFSDAFARAMLGTSIAIYVQWKYARATSRVCITSAIEHSESYSEKSLMNAHALWKKDEFPARATINFNKKPVQHRYWLFSMLYEATRAYLLFSRNPSSTKKSGLFTRSYSTFKAVDSGSSNTRGTRAQSTLLAFQYYFW